MDDVETGVATAAARSNKRIQPFDVDLGACIRALRIAAGMNQTALAAVVDLSHLLMQGYEAGKDRVSAGTLFRFATALNIPVRSFFESAPQHAPSNPMWFGAGDALSAKIVVLFRQIDHPGIRKQLVALMAALVDRRAGEAPESANGAPP